MPSEVERLERFLRAGGATVGQSASGKVLLQAHDGRGAVAASPQAVERLVASGLVLREGDTLRLAAAEASGDPLGARARIVEALPQPGVEGPALVNLAESPLGALARRRGKDGASFLGPGEFQAGERLRADFTRGSMMPRLGANWVASVASGRRHGGSGVSDLTDAALAARLRVERALDAVGPELSGVLVDVCCFLKGLEQVESERGWPVRSAKVVLKSALGALARHYDPRAGQRRAPGAVLHWGAADYRPKVR